MDPVDIVKKTYDDTFLAEWERLDRHPFEFELNKRFILRYIKPGDRILDMGGGPGRYAIWLSEIGCDVTLVDLSKNNIDYALEMAAQRGLVLRVIQADARFLDALSGELFDHVLLMGPLYHLPDENDRIKVIRETMSLLKTSGTLFAAFISAYAAAWDYLTRFPDRILTPEVAPYIDCLVNNKDFSGIAFSANHFITPDHILPFMSIFDLEKLHLFGSESFLPMREAELKNEPVDVINAWLDVAENLSERKDILSFTHHLMYVGKKVQ